MDCETWRKETNLDEVVPGWVLPNKEQLFEFYPQYYHKTDRVIQPLSTRLLLSCHHLIRQSHY
jgi:hypothetical protein